MITRIKSIISRQTSSLLILLAFGLFTTVTAGDKKDIVDTAVSAKSFNTLVAAVQTAGLVETLKSEGPFTVFAPTDEAFAKLPKGTVENFLKPENKEKLIAILTYHVVPGNVTAKKVTKLNSATTVFGQDVTIKKKYGSVMIDGAKVVKTDIECENGIIHVIDSVILPKDIVEVAANANIFNTLLAAAKAADLVETLKSDGPFTVFAPTDEAFSKLPEGTVTDLLKPSNQAKLKSILTYHVVPGKVTAAQVTKLNSAKTVSGQKISISTSQKSVMVDNATVIKTDIPAINGIVHVIDSVILPKSL